MFVLFNSYMNPGIKFAKFAKCQELVQYIHPLSIRYYPSLAHNN